MSLQDKNRVLVVTLSLFFLFSLLIVQYFHVQIVQGEKWSTIADRQHYFTVKDPFIRGSFYSNTSIKHAHPERPRKLVVDIQKFHLVIDPASMPIELHVDIAKNLKNILNLTEKQYASSLEHLQKKSRRRVVTRWLCADQKDQVLQWWYGYAKGHRLPRNALYAEADYQRSYPYGKLLGAVLHTVQSRREETTGHAIATGGLELQFDKYLQGCQGCRRLMRSPRNAFEIGEVVQLPKNGADVYLTINHVLQAIAEQELAKGVIKAKAKGGWAAMMDPHTGEIFALAQYPFFYPANYAEYFNNPDSLDATRVKAVTDAIEPGSIMKAISVAVGLKANREIYPQKIFDPNAKMATADSRFPGRKPLKDFRVYHFLNMSMALKYSSNIYFARVIERVVNHLGPMWYRQQLQEIFGFGQLTGIELPGETAGMIPTPGKKHANGKLEWSTPTPFSMAIGHNIQVNAIQVLRAYATLANGGYLVKPTLVRKIVREGEVLVDHTTPERRALFPKVLDEEVVREIVKGLQHVTHGKRCDIAGYTQAGKTGTAEKIINGVYSKDRNISSFVGFAPVDNPLFVLIVSIDEPEKNYYPGIGSVQYGGFCAAPVFKEIGRKTLQYLGVTPDDPYGYPVGDPRYDPERAHWASEAKALTQLFDEWNTR